MTKCRWLPLLTVLLLTSCCPLVGQLMKLSEGIESFSVQEGRLVDLQLGDRLLVLAPFAKTDQAFFICKGEIEEQFADELAKAGLFRSESYFERQPSRLGEVTALLRSASGEELRQELHLAEVPQTILFGTLLQREASVAPTRGVIMEERYRLEFFNVASHKAVVVEIAVRDLAERSIAAAVAELKDRLRQAQKHGDS